MNVYNKIDFTVAGIKGRLKGDGAKNARILQALETVAQKAADRAAITVGNDDAELCGILAGLQAFEAQFSARSSYEQWLDRNFAPPGRSAADLDTTDTWETYCLIADVVDHVNHPLNAERVNDARTFQAFETAAQKAADLAVIATGDNAEELRRIFLGLKEYTHQLDAQGRLYAYVTERGLPWDR